MNILLTSVGRRAYMVKYFKSVAGSEGQVHVCNSDDNSVSFAYADRAVVSPLIYSEEYIPFLLEYCTSNSIDILVPLFDIDLLVLAKHKQAFTNIGTAVIVSDPEFISVCNDKWKTYLYLTSNSFNAPKTFCRLDDAVDALKEGVVSYPLVIKPRFGCGSLSVSIAEDEMGLQYHFRNIHESIRNSYLTYESSQVDISEQIIFQEYLHGQEYGSDIINDLNGRVRSVIIRKKIAMRSGETDIAEIIADDKIKQDLIRLGKITGHIGNLDVDLFLADEKLYILELNARFGGGYPFSHMGGCDLPKAIVEWVKGSDVPDSMLESTIGLKGFKEIVITSIR